MRGRRSREEASRARLTVVSPRPAQAASGCIIEYVGRLACFAGYKKDRRRGKDYLRWLLEQRTGRSDVDDPKSREDCTIVRIPSSSVAFLTGYRGESLRGIERESSTFCFTDGDRNDRSKSTENLLIFSFSRSAREHAAEIVEDRLDQHKRMGVDASGAPLPPDGEPRERERFRDEEMRRRRKRSRSSSSSSRSRSRSRDRRRKSSKKSSKRSRKKSSKKKASKKRRRRRDSSSDDDSSDGSDDGSASSDSAADRKGRKRGSRRRR